MFTLFAAPPDQSLDWSDSGVEGSFRFLNRLWKIVMDHKTVKCKDISHTDLTSEQKKLRLKTHQTLQKVTDDYGRRQTFNTAIAASMELLNTTTKFNESNKQKNDLVVVQESLETVILMLAPIVPHFSHALWNQLGHKNAVINESWPAIDDRALAQDSVMIVIQVNGKVRDKIEVSITMTKEELEQEILKNKSVNRFIEGKEVNKIIVVPGRLVNVVAN